ncbi:Hypothetical predicted protein [Cloeon dipterum]|uniref:Condensin complex subunit 2 n=3 Tax=Cloeon dipterum TaxID=197152 RepID=A0A8S1DYJ7_9INSE|nr:Hypothetical predicted protein [Cloeon dipterum]
MMEVDPSTSSDPGALYRALPQPVVQISRLDLKKLPTNNNNVHKVSNQGQSSHARSQKLPAKMSLGQNSSSGSRSAQSAAPSAPVAAEESDCDEEDLYLVSRASVQITKLMEQFNCLMKIYHDKNANFQVELSKLLHELMVKVVAPSDVADPSRGLNFGRLALILQGSTTIYSKKVEFLADLLTQFILRLSSEIGKAAVGLIGGDDDEEEAAVDDESQIEKNAQGKQQGRRKKVQNASATPFVLLDLKIKKCATRMSSIRKIQLRPKIFTVLFYNDQCDKDKQRVTTLNPELAGETTCYRMWAPLNESRGLLNPDCKDDVYTRFASSNFETEVEEPLIVREENPEMTEPPEMSIENYSDTEESMAIDDSQKSEITPEETDPVYTEDSFEEKELMSNDSTDDPWKTLSPGDTIEDLRLQPQPPIPKFKSRVELEIDEAYFRTWYKEAKKTRGCFGDENIHEGLALEKEGKLLDHADAKFKRKRIDIDSDRSCKKFASTIEDLFEHHDSDDEDLLGFSDNKPIYQIATSNLPIPNMSEMEDWCSEPDLNNDGPEGLLFDPIPSDDEKSDAESTIDFQPAEDPKESAARVDAFMKFMKQRFAEDEQKPKFSFKSYCDAIIDTFPNGDEKKEEIKVNFKELLSDTSAGQDCARQLLATLMLANLKNVEVEGCEEGTLAGESFDVRLLNRTRHITTFEEDEQFS